MGYIGQAPANKAITSADIEDGVVIAADIADDAITLAKMASGTDGNIISYDASGNPVAIATGNDGQVLTSTGAGSPPAFEAASSFNADAAQVFNESGADADFRIESDGDPNMFVLNAGNNNIGISNPTPSTNAKFHISRGGYRGGGTDKHALMVGADIGDANALTNSSRKLGSIVAPHYTNAEEPITIARLDSDNGSSELRIGGTAETNSTEKIIFRTATDDADKTTGADRMTITSDGRGLSQFTAKGWAHFDGTGTPSISDHHNVSSLSDSETGQIRVNFSNNMANANYAAIVNSWWGYAYTGGAMDMAIDGFKATTSNGSAYTDTNSIMVLWFGD